MEKIPDRGGRLGSGVNLVPGSPAWDAVRQRQRQQQRVDQNATAGPFGKDTYGSILSTASSKPIASVRPSDPQPPTTNTFWARCKRLPLLKALACLLLTAPLAAVVVPTVLAIVGIAVPPAWLVMIGLVGLVALGLALFVLLDKGREAQAFRESRQALQSSNR